MQMEEILFKKNNHTRWPVVQLYRNLLIVILSTFIPNPVYLVLSFIPICLVFVVHDKHRAPYKHTYLNVLQMLSSGFLLLVSVCNIPPAFSFIVNLNAIPYMSIVLPLLRYTELVLYCAMPCSLLAWRLQDKLRKK